LAAYWSARPFLGCSSIVIALALLSFVTAASPCTLYVCLTTAITDYA